MHRTIASVALILACASTAFAGSSFKDIPKDHWAAQSVQMVAEAGIMKGTKAGKFEPDKTVTRAELAVALSAMVQYIAESRKPVIPEKKTKPESSATPASKPAAQQKTPPQASAAKTSPKTPTQAVSFLKDGGYLPKKSPILKGGTEKITPDELADALSSVTKRLIELDVPAKNDVD